MGEDLAWAGEAACGQWLGMLRSLMLFQGSTAGGAQAFGRVALAQADELVALPDSGPGQGAVEEAGGELAHRGALLGGLGLDAVGSPQGVGRELSGIVGIVSGATACPEAGGGGP